MKSEKLTLEFAKAALGENFDPDCQYFLHTTETGFIIDRVNPVSEERAVFPLRGDPEDSLYSYEFSDEIPASSASSEPGLWQRLLWRILLYPWQITTALTALAMAVVLLLLSKAGAM